MSGKDERWNGLPLRRSSEEARVSCVVRKNDGATEPMLVSVSMLLVVCTMPTVMSNGPVAVSNGISKTPYHG